MQSSFLLMSIVTRLSLVVYSLVNNLFLHYCICLSPSGDPLSMRSQRLTSVAMPLLMSIPSISEALASEPAILDISRI